MIGGAAVYRAGVSVNYKCYYPKPHPFWKCKKKIPTDCFRCQYCEAKMRAQEATKLLDMVEKLKIEKRYGWKREEELKND